MKILFFANRMPDLCGAFLHDIDLATELQRRGHQIVFLTIEVPKEGFNGGTYRGFRFLHHSATTTFLDQSELWITPHSPILPQVRKINSRGYNRPLIATCHFDGNYTAIVGNVANARWAEMLWFINSVMEPNYRKNIAPWPSAIVRTEVVRPILHRNQIEIAEPFQGDCITLVNANHNKGVHIFIDLAKRLPNRKFLGVLPYYGERQLPAYPSNIEWVPFQDDIRTVLRRTRILLVPSYYESYGRIAMEAMVNGIPVLYSKPAVKSVYPGGSTEGMDSWIRGGAIACSREGPEDWIAAIELLDSEEEWSKWSTVGKTHIEAMDIFSEVTRIAQMAETFAREHPVVIRTTTAQPAPQPKPSPGIPRQPQGPAGFGFVNGQLRIRR